MESLLLDLSANRNVAQSENHFVYALSSDDGLENLHALLYRNNRLAYVFFPPALNRIMRKEKQSLFIKILTSANIFLRHIPIATEQNIHSLCVAFSHYSIYGSLDKAFYADLLQMIITSKNNENFQRKFMIVLYACCKKYMDLPRSDELYLEINMFVTMFGEFVLYCLVSQIGGEYALFVYEALISHDMPDFFETHKNDINKVLLRNLSSRDEIILATTSNIYTQYILKYSDLFSIDEMIETFFDSVNNRRVLIPEDANLLYFFLKQKHVKLLEKNQDVLIKTLMRMCVIDLGDDPLVYTTNAFKIETDPYRGKIAEMIKLVDKILVIDYKKYFVICTEPVLFYCTVLGAKLNPYVELAICKISLDQYMLNTLLRFYLLAEIPYYGIEYLTDRIFKKDFSFFQIIRYFSYIIEQASEGINTDIWTSQVLENVLNNSIMIILLEYDTKNIDMFRSRYIFLALKNKYFNKSFIISSALQTYIYDMLYDVEKLTLWEAYNPLFDAFTFLIKEINFHKEAFVVATRIYEKDIRELFPFMFQIHAMLIKNEFYDRCMLNIFTNSQLWQERSYTLPLSMLALSLYRTGKVPLNQMENVCRHLITFDPHTAYIIMRNLKYQDQAVYFAFVMQVAHKNVYYDEIIILLSNLCLNEGRILYALEKCLDEMLIKTVRLQCVDEVKESCLRLMRVNDPNIREKAKMLFERNKGRKGCIDLLNTVVDEFIRKK